ncbi:related to SIP2 - dominant suppressor of some ts mutations in RPO21 and PRP4 [Cephalotrichum gorgonifer]|uniref:Related to SIP2 - dominant suppressor of some ts mutations in RPO21 and PRP4 n=1 Tax=Cephalotrichum gorgonifer TaxID=2041049 RepID=A0AAE8MRK9_9PEZI|nr:related to SIP2 - dominant suppressor of some ts mutations in RPO21 and PRP4 [Cephalotrichum gorgonifer]
MGNNPSSTAAKPAIEQASTSSHDAGVSRPASKRDSKNIIPMHASHRVAAPPEESLASATRSNVITHPKPLPQSVAGLGSPSPPTGFNSTGAAATSSYPHRQHPPKASDERPIPIDEPSKPVDVPMEPSSARSHHNPVEPHLLSQNSVTDMSYATRPPRLPLPIEEELHTPGSPIIAPDDAGESLADVDALDSDMTRKSSAISGMSAEDEDEEDAEGLVTDKTRPTVPTKLQWLRGGDKVYVTGTIFHWNRKHRLHPVEGRPGVFETTINILPGTHHIRFLVDGVMQTSPDLPTTVDFGNNLVNYIERQGREQADLGGPAAGTEAKEEPKIQRGRPVLPADQYHHQIPKYLVDFDQPEDSSSYQYAVSAIEKLPNPPALPGFLGKPILNAATPIRDDNSVLNLPNHTILNHLATSSIKNNVLAVSATTRYRNKYVTTIVYKPTSPDD